MACTDIILHPPDTPYASSAMPGTSELLTPAAVPAAAWPLANSHQPAVIARFGCRDHSPPLDALRTVVLRL